MYFIHLYDESPLFSAVAIANSPAGGSFLLCISDFISYFLTFFQIARFTYVPD
jgi:hypothetical protein